MKRTLAALCLFLSAPAFPHGGPTDSHGCHNERSSSTYHCHSGANAGNSYASQAEMLELTILPVTAEAFFGIPPIPYSRPLYRHWIDADGDCQDTRQEVLIAESATPVVLNASGCRVVSGLWHDPFTGQTFTNPSDLDIDHMVPLGEAHNSGAWAWTPEQKEAYANDLILPFALIAVDDWTNQSKNNRDPANWMPSNEEYRCSYLFAWVAVKAVYSLRMDEIERKAVYQGLSRCPVLSN